MAISAGSRRSVDRVELLRLLSNTATTREVVRGLMALGLTAPVLSTVVGTTDSAVRNWASGQSEPRQGADIVLEDLRTAASILLNETDMEVERVAAWFVRRLPDTRVRPIDEIAANPTAVIDAALAQTDLFAHA